MHESKYEREAMKAALETQAVLSELSAVVPRRKIQVVPGASSTSKREIGERGAARLDAAKAKRDAKAKRRLKAA